MGLDEDTAREYIRCAREADKRRRPQECLEYRLKAASIFEDLGMLEEQAKTLDWAGKTAYFMRDYYLKADLKEKAGCLYEGIGYFKDAGYAYLHAADALLSTEDREKNAERINMLMEKGQKLLEREVPYARNRFLTVLKKDYRLFQKEQKARKPQDVQEAYRHE